MTAMRALWLVRENLTQHPGGDTTQILRTAEALRAKGVHVELSADPLPDLAGFDVVHLFHLDRLWENVPHCRRIRTHGIPAVLSTIYWPPDEFDHGGRDGIQGKLARAFGSRAYETMRLMQRWAMHVSRQPRGARLSVHMLGFARAARYLLETVHVLLPNGVAERKAIEKRFGVTRPAVIVPNAAEVALFGDQDQHHERGHQSRGKEEAFEPPNQSRDFAGQSHDRNHQSRARQEAGSDLDQPQERDLPSHDRRSAVEPIETTRHGILCVGRIEPRKNQHALIAALRGAEIPLTIVGGAGRYSTAYAARCHELAGPNVRFISHQSPEQLRQLYRVARVHACVSWYETPGLASLEAALCGCALVVTPGGCTREYFEEDAEYCEPDDVVSIRRAVDAALARGPSDTLAKRIAHECTWQKAAERTLAGYELALGKPRS